MPLSPARAAALLAENVQRVIQGKPEVVRLAVVALFAEGHLLHRGRARPRQDDAGPLPGPQHRRQLAAGSSSPPTCCPAT